MPLRLDSQDPAFPAAFDALVNGRREADADVSRDVAAILKRVRSEGDAALADYTQQFDRHDLEASGWEIPAAERKAALAGLSRELRDALELAADRIATYHEKQGRRTATAWTARAFGWAHAGGRWMRQGCMSPAAVRPIPVHC